MLDLPIGSSCLVDTNIFYSHFVNVPDVSLLCTRFVRRISDGEIQAYVTSGILADLLHKLMLAEASEKFGFERTGIVNRLRHLPEQLSELTAYSKTFSELDLLPLQIVEVNRAMLNDAPAISRKYGLLTNDAILVAAMSAANLTDIATNDDDFARVTDIRVWKPR